MRRDPTDAEKRLWKHLRGAQLAAAKFRRQQPIGPYVVDFVCQAHRLIVEADGSQHAGSEHDARRDGFLESKGYRVLRFWNNDILTNMAGVSETIRVALQTPHPPIASQWAPPSPSRGEGFGKDLT
ncbi:MAG: endonuclease domain-containing protein [Sphingomonas sp.]|nr:endonuclease domain-containing protein [Sphingomonas sp.]